MVALAEILILYCSWIYIYIYIIYTNHGRVSFLAASYCIECFLVHFKWWCTKLSLLVLCIYYYIRSTVRLRLTVDSDSESIGLTARTARVRFIATKNDTVRRIEAIHPPHSFFYRTNILIGNHDILTSTRILYSIGDLTRSSVQPGVCSRDSSGSIQTICLPSNKSDRHLKAPRNQLVAIIRCRY